MIKKVKKTESEWRAQLSEDAYNVCWNKGTEQPFTGKYNSCKDPGIYACVCCENELFSSETKFDSGTGWPSFFSPISEGAILEVIDNSHNMRRIEVVCALCNSHLGHVFPDGPPPTGQRYCLNSVALKLSRKY